VVSALRKERTVIAADRPGYDGHTPAGGVAYNAAAGLARLERSGAERATVVGHGFGGAVAAWLAATHPQRVSGLVLIAAAANRESLTPIDHALAAPVAGRLLGGALLTGVGLLPRAERLRQFAEERFQIPDTYLKANACRLRRRSVHRAFTVEQRALIREMPQLEQLLPRISAPTMVIVGTADRVVPLPAGRRLVEQIAHARTVDVEGAGHLLNWTHPQLIAELILRGGNHR
jgi:pimeloyl-ACP methyl ester carboxylesterase